MLYYVNLNKGATMYTDIEVAIAKHCSIALSELRKLKDSVYYIDEHSAISTLCLDTCIVYFQQILVGTIVIVEALQ